MRHKRRHIDDPILDQPDGPRPRIAVPVLEPQIDLLRAEPHKGNTHVRFPDPDHEDFAPELDAVDGRCDGGFHARAFERHGGFGARGGGHDGGGAVGG